MFQSSLVHRLAVSSVKSNRLPLHQYIGYGKRAEEKNSARGRFNDSEGDEAHQPTNICRALLSSVSAQYNAITRYPCKRADKQASLTPSTHAPLNFPTLYFLSQNQLLGLLRRTEPACGKSERNSVCGRW